MAVSGRKILEMDVAQKKKWLESFDIVFLDCEGVIWLYMEPVPKTGTAIQLLKMAGKKCYFVSNNSMRSDEEYLRKFNTIGVSDVDPTDIVHPVKTISRYLIQNMPGKPVFSLGSSQFNNILSNIGFEVKTLMPALNMNANDVAKLKPVDKVAAVILDMNFNITFNQMAKAHQYLLDENCKLIVGATDRLIPMTRDFTAIGVEGYLNILRETTGRQAIELGKPGAALGFDLIDQFNIVDPTRALFVGDSLDLDIKFANSFGFQTLFVLTGTSTEADMARMSTHLKPNYVANSLADFIPFFRDIGAID